MADGQVVFEISADGKKAMASIDDITDALKKAGHQWESDASQSADSISNKFADMFKKIGAAAVAAKVGDALLSFGKDAIQVASDLEEVQNVVDVTFGQAGAAKIDAWAKSASSSFGLTELQAKQFTSTLGAMMKSSGLAGDQIIDMSTDLAGLAADMASFYNLDFETAFQKIRSGISGETEPLKQLGINMSVVNLEAFALTQGITKAFSEMSQGEQTMLRYQYIMQATADAQGDFASTADGYANTVRTLETQVANLKAKVGEPLLGVVSDAASVLTGFLDALSSEKNDRTILDDIAEINIDETTKIEEIKAIAAQASSLLDSLGEISTKLGTSGDIGGYFEDIKLEIGGLDSALTDNNIKDGLNTLAQDINDADVADGEFAESLGELQGSVDGLDTTLSETKNGIVTNLGSISGALPTNASAGDAAKTAFENVGAGLTALNTAAGTAEDQDTSQTLKDISDELPNDSTAGAGANEAFTKVASGLSLLTEETGKASGVPDALGALAEGMKNVTPETGALTQGLDSVTESVKDLNIKVSNAKTNDVKGKLADLAAGLSVELGGDANKWTNLLQAISGNAAQAIAATSGDTGATATFLESVAASADDLTTDYSTLWGNLLAALGDNGKAAITALATEGDPGAILSAIAGGANSLSEGTADEWSAFVSAIDGIKISDAKGLQGVANALATNIGGDADKWSNLLGAIKSNAGGALKAIGDNDGSTAKAFLENVAAGAGDYTTDYSAYWTNLLSALGDNAADAISSLSGGGTAGANVTAIAGGANLLDASSPGLWRSLLNVLKNVNGLTNIFSDSGAGNVADLATALSNNAPDSTRAEAWKKFLDALGTNAGALSQLTGTSAAETKEWLVGMASAVNEANLDPTDADAWSKLMTAFVAGLPGLGDTEGGQQFYQQLIQSFLAMGSESEVARAGLTALGLESDDITKAQERWLAICQQLVKTIPGLADIISLETGEIKGGTKAVQEYVDSWKADQILRTRIDALKQQKELLENEMSIDWETKVDVQEAMAYAELLKTGRSEYEAKRIINDARKQRGIYKPYVNESEWNVTSTNRSSEEARRRGAGEYAVWKVSEQEAQALKNLLSLEDQRDQAIKNNAYVIDYLNEKIAAMTEETGKSEEELFGMSEAADETAENLSEVTTALENAQNVFQELADYQEKVRDETQRSVDGIIKGFEKLETPMQKQRRELAELEKASLDEAKSEEERAAALKKLNEAKAKIDSGEGQVTIHSMTEGLDSQLKYMQEYQDMLETARANGVSEELLASLSDGSQESYDYLYALTTQLDKLGDEERTDKITKLNEAYQQVQDEASKFTDELTKQKLAVDDTFKSLVEAAQEAAAGLNVSGEAYESVTAVVEAIANGLGDNASKVQKQVDAILEQIARLSGATNYGSVPTWGGSIAFIRTFAGKAANADVDGTSANGLDNVPFDGYLALLHQGERIQTAAEADLARRYSYQQPAFDYGALGGAIGANISAGGGNVYLDGQTVGRIISDRQANSYRALERSGWQG